MPTRFLSDAQRARYGSYNETPSRDQLAREGQNIDPADIARTSPLAHQHINLLDRHTFGLPETVATGKLRPLRQPDYA